jgi:hypothetical protein
MALPCFLPAWSQVSFSPFFVIGMMADLAAIIEIEAKAQGLDPLLVQAICEHEAQGNAYKVRFEPAWRYFHFPAEWASRLLITVETEKTCQAMSWGPMQVMGAVAREMGFEQDLTYLTEAATGIRFGCKKLKALLVHYGNEMDAISAYNQGSPRKTAGGLYMNAKTYVDPIAARLRELRKLQ